MPKESKPKTDPARVKLFGTGFTSTLLSSQRTTTHRQSAFLLTPGALVQLYPPHFLASNPATVPKNRHNRIRPPKSLRAARSTAHRPKPEAISRVSTRTAAPVPRRVPFARPSPWRLGKHYTALRWPPNRPGVVRTTPRNPHVRTGPASIRHGCRGCRRPRSGRGGQDAVDTVTGLAAGTTPRYVGHRLNKVHGKVGSTVGTPSVRIGWERRAACARRWRLATRVRREHCGSRREEVMRPAPRGGRCGLRPPKEGRPAYAHRRPVRPTPTGGRSGLHPGGQSGLHPGGRSGLHPRGDSPACNRRGDGRARKHRRRSGVQPPGNGRPAPREVSPACARKRMARPAPAGGRPAPAGGRSRLRPGSDALLAR